MKTAYHEQDPNEPDGPMGPDVTRPQRARDFYWDACEYDWLGDREKFIACLDERDAMIRADERRRVLDLILPICEQWGALATASAIRAALNPESER